MSKRWKPFGKESITEIEAFRRGCGNSSCIHLKADISMTPKNAEMIIDRLEKAVKYAKG